MYVRLVKFCTIFFAYRTLITLHIIITMVAVFGEKKTTGKRHFIKPVGGRTSACHLTAGGNHSGNGPSFVFQVSSLQEAQLLQR